MELSIMVNKLFSMFAESGLLHKFSPAEKGAGENKRIAGIYYRTLL